MQSTEVRERFLRFFEKHGHRRVPSSSLIPAEDPTLLFTNAGMNQFKDVFTGREKRDYARAATAQKCVRAGGKHNDLDNVGYTGRHHTFFEMLGNFSFGDYFKDEAIAFAWELVTGRDGDGGYGLDPERLWATVYTDDDEAARLWERHLPANRVLRFGEKENFWAMGETGPCGPCSELHYYRGANLAGNRPALVNGPGDDTLEIWNLVFMQFDRDASGKMTPLPRPSVDTGLGLERLTAILQGVNNNFDTDLFAPILAKIGELSGQTLPRGHGARGRPVPRHRRPRPGGDDARGRRGPALERGARLRSAAGSAAGDAVRAAPGPRTPVSPPPRARRDGGLRGRLLRQGAGGVGRPDRGRRARAGRGALRPDPFRGRRPRGRGDRASAARGGHGALGRDRLPFLRHLRHPPRSHRGDRGRRGRRGRSGGLRGGDGAPAGRLPVFAEVRGRRRLGLRAAGAARTAFGLPGLSRAGLRPSRRRARARDRAGRTRSLASSRRDRAET